MTTGPQWGPPPTEGVRPYTYVRLPSSPPKLKEAQPETAHDPAAAEATEDRTEDRELAYRVADAMREIRPDLGAIADSLAAEALTPDTLPGLEEFERRATAGTNRATVARVLSHREKVPAGARDYAETNRAYVEEYAIRNGRYATAQQAAQKTYHNDALEDWS